MKPTGSAWRKTAVAVLAVSMLAGSATGIASAKNNKGHDNQGNHGNQGNKGKVEAKYNFQFKDLDEAQWKWAYAHIIRLVSQGVFQGYDDGSFKPQNNISRIETIVAAVRLLGLEAEAQKAENMNANLNFKDFDQLKKKYPQAVGYVAVALKNDLFSENEDMIQPEKPATRLWASVLLVKGLKLEAEAKARMNVDLPFKDENDIPAGSVGYVAIAVERGVISGYTDKTFQPNKPVTRAELASILDRLGIQLPDQGNTDQSNQPVTGTITVSANNAITVLKSDNTTVSIPLDAGVFIFRNEVKSTVSALKPGDQVLVRTYQGKAVFIEVTKMADENVAFADSGKINTITFNDQGKIATIALNRDIYGSNSTVVYNVAADVTITGGNGVLAANLVVVVKGQNQVVKEIQVVGN